MTSYNIKTGLKKLSYLGITLLPFVFKIFTDNYPALAQMSVMDIVNYLLGLIYPNLGSLTIAGLLVMLVNYLKFKQTILGRQKKEIENRKE